MYDARHTIAAFLAGEDPADDHLILADDFSQAEALLRRLNDGGHRLTQWRPFAAATPPVNGTYLVWRPGIRPVAAAWSSGDWEDASPAVTRSLGAFTHWAEMPGSP